ncbi:hypothetical protein DFP72DRAFT_891340 [Ephemerocybe angulata]|uniref:Uncharacterized protein n=1 Tax=Ephemerocybe angulata TaxID=980116 RepID=A0A8H6I2B7_9AGAR|nr:hypothetical protein DFP72DRAFT_891340 [Tulosesus angulatus]
MLSLLPRRALLHHAARPALRSAPRRNAHTEVQKPPGSEKEGGSDDFRPSWVYSLSRLGSHAIIPAVALYAVFLYDWGDQEHVFMPPRRWLAKVKQSYFKLSSEEERMLNAEIVEQRVRRLPPGTRLDLESPPLDQIRAELEASEKELS